MVRQKWRQDKEKVVGYRSKMQLSQPHLFVNNRGKVEQRTGRESKFNWAGLDVAASVGKR
jgi:hypothetical protein